MGGCGICNRFFSNFMKRPHFRNWVRKSPYMFFIDISWYTDGIAYRYFQKTLGIDPGGSISMGLYWKKPDGTTFKAGMVGPGGNRFICNS